MITITIQGIDVTKGSVVLSGSLCSVGISGHSGQAAKGNDIVCAGISALSQSAVLALDLYEIALNINQQEGLLEFSFNVTELNDAQKIRCESILSVFIVGISEIRKQYPEFVHIIIKG